MLKKLEEVLGELFWCGLVRSCLFGLNNVKVEMWEWIKIMS